MRNPVWLRHLLRFALAGLATVLLLETVLRLASLLPASSTNYVHDADVGFRMRPFQLIGGAPTNALGYNDVDHGKNKPLDEYRVGVIGDSFVVGAVPREHVFTSIVQGLADGEVPSLRILNLGISGAGPENYLRILRTDGVALGIDRALVMLFVGNDIEQADPDFVTRIFFGSPRSILRSASLFRLSPDYFYTFRLSRAAIRLARERWQRDVDQQGSFSETTFLRIERHRMAIAERELPERIEARYRHLVELLGNLQEVANDLGIELAIVLAPDQFQVDAGLRDRVAARYGLDLEDFDLEQPQRFLVGELQNLEVDYIDLLPLFQENTERDLYLVRDSHWNEEGNRLTGEAIIDFIDLIDR